MLKRLILSLSLSVAIVTPLIVFGAASYNVSNATAPAVNEWGTCYAINNNSGKSIFIPTNSSAEWSSFYSHLPSGVTAGSCCTPSGVNHNGCYQNSMWAIDSCNNPQYIMDGCAGSFCTSGNVVTYKGCGGDLNGGTCITPDTTICGNGCANGSCNACAANYGQACTSAANVCGSTNSGTYDCTGACSATTPASSCGTCQSPAANTWYVDYFIYTFDDPDCNYGWYGESGTIGGEYWTVVEPSHAGLTNSIDTGNSCFWFNARGAYSRAYSRSPIYDNGGSWYYNNCGVCGGSC